MFVEFTDHALGRRPLCCTEHLCGERRGLSNKRRLFLFDLGRHPAGPIVAPPGFEACRCCLLRRHGASDLDTNTHRRAALPQEASYMVNFWPRWFHCDNHDPKIPQFIVQISSLTVEPGTDVERSVQRRREIPL